MILGILLLLQNDIGIPEGVLYTGIAGIISAFGFPKIFTYLKESRENKIKELQAERDLYKEKAEAYRAENELTRSKLQLIAANFESYTEMVEILGADNEDLQKVVKNMKAKFNQLVLVNANAI